jgi:D-alanyl-D-alanine carboxypeptidase
MKNKIMLSLFFALSLTLLPLNQGAAQALTQEEEEKLIQQIDILQQEIKTLQSLILNFQLRQEITAESYLAVDLSDDSVLLSKSSDELHPIASITKLMTAVITLENIDLNRTIILTDEMLKPLGGSPTLFSGLTIRAEDLLKACIIQSTNDAAETLS